MLAQVGESHRLVSGLEVLKIIDPPKPTKSVRLRDGGVTAGKSCAAFGHPLTVVDPTTQSFRIFSSAASGIVSMPTDMGVFPNTKAVSVYELDFFTHGGSSGGAVFLRNGTVIGHIHGSRLLDDGKGNQIRSNLTVAINVNEAIEFLKPLNVKVKLGGSSGP